MQDIQNISVLVVCSCDLRDPYRIVMLAMQCLLKHEDVGPLRRAQSGSEWQDLPSSVSESAFRMFDADGSGKLQRAQLDLHWDGKGMSSRFVRILRVQASQASLLCERCQA